MIDEEQIALGEMRTRYKIIKEKDDHYQHQRRTTQNTKSRLEVKRVDSQYEPVLEENDEALGDGDDSLYKTKSEEKSRSRV